MAPRSTGERRKLMNVFKEPGSMFRNVMFMPIFLPKKPLSSSVFQFKFREAKSATPNHKDSDAASI